MRKYVIIAVSVLVVIGLVVGGMLVFRSRSFGGGILVPENSGAATSDSQQPKVVCGNYACEAGETPQSCPEDCVLAQQADLGAHSSIDDQSGSNPIIRLDTNVPSRVSIKYGLTDKFELGTADDGSDYKINHKVKLNGMANDASFYFQMTVSDRSGTERIMGGQHFTN